MAKKILFITLNPPKPSTKQRLLDSLDYLNENGIECALVPAPNGLMGRARLLLSVKKYDAVFIQKKLFRKLEMALMRFLNSHIAFDVDDAIMFHEVERSEKLTGRFFKRYLTMLEYSKAVLVGNRFLYEFSRYNNRNVHIVPTPINVTIYNPKDYSVPSDQVTIGWMGTPGNLKYLKIIEGPLQEIGRKYPNVQFKIISKSFRDMQGIETIKKEWSYEEEVEDLRSLDIGIMPLADDIWAKGKSGNKILQYFGVAVPVVASPVGVNSDIIEHGEDGYLARTDAQWVEHLSSLIEDSGKRRAMGFKGREKVLMHYSQEVHSRELFRILYSVLDRRDTKC